MRISQWCSPILILIMAICFPLTIALNRNPLVILISFDGFKFELLNETMVPHIYKWANRGTWFVNGVQSQHVTYTNPNHMSIVTGLFEESHGIVSNLFYDTKENLLFDYFNYTKRVSKESTLEEHWYLGEPLWLTNERGGSQRRSASYDWPLSDANYPSPPHKPTFVRSWSQKGNLTTWMDDVDQIVEQFTKEKDPINFVSWYIAEPDSVLHSNGFYNGAFQRKITELDKLFDYFLAKIEDLDLDSYLNIILTADHGHAEIKSFKSILCLRDYVLGDGFEMGDHMVYPKDEAHGREVFANLTRAVTDGYDVEILWKKDIPEMWHYSNSSRVGQIVINPKIGSSTSFSCNKTIMEALFGPNGTKVFNSSTHGMDPRQKDMRALLVMNGPAFVNEKKIFEIPQNIDLYPLVCHILGVTAAPNNGSLNIVGQSLKKLDNFMNRSAIFDMFTDTLGFFVIVLPSICIVFLFFIYGCRHTVMKDDPNWSRPDVVRGYSRLAIGVEEGESVRMERRGFTEPHKGALLDELSSEDEL